MRTTFTQVVRFPKKLSLLAVALLLQAAFPTHAWAKSSKALCSPTHIKAILKKGKEKPRTYKIDHGTFYKEAKKHRILSRFKNLQTGQFGGIDDILKFWNKSLEFKDDRWLAYMLATTYHETAGTMRPIQEYGKGAGRPYGRKHKKTRKRYYGRGYVQLTWHFNYLKADKQLKRQKLAKDKQLVWNPSMAMEYNIARKVLYTGMREGWFVPGHCLARHFRPNRKADWKNARRMINGLDKWSLIKREAQAFVKVIKNSKVKIDPKLVVKAKPTDKDKDQKVGEKDKTSGEKPTDTTVDVAKLRAEIYKKAQLELTTAFNAKLEEHKNSTSDLLERLNKEKEANEATQKAFNDLKARFVAEEKANQSHLEKFLSLEQKHADALDQIDQYKKLQHEASSQLSPQEKTIFQKLVALHNDLGNLGKAGKQHLVQLRSENTRLKNDIANLHLQLQQSQEMFQKTEDKLAQSKQIEELKIIANDSLANSTKSVKANEFFMVELHKMREENEASRAKFKDERKSRTQKALGHIAQFKQNNVEVKKELAGMLLLIKDLKQKDSNSDQIQNKLDNITQLLSELKTKNKQVNKNLWTRFLEIFKGKETTQN